MPRLSEIDLPPAVQKVLEPFVGDKLVSPYGESIWIEQGQLHMCLEDIGEGLNGDYDEEDPSDRPLLRFSFYAKNEGSEALVELDETSYCTEIYANASWEIKIVCVCEIFDRVFKEICFEPDEEVDGSLGRQISRTCETASWTSSSGRETLEDELRAALEVGILAKDLPQASSVSRKTRI